jgi:hypothetical protein
MTADSASTGKTLGTPVGVGVQPQVATARCWFLRSGGKPAMPPFYTWMLRVFLLVSLCVFSITLSAMWPGARSFRWTEVAGVAGVRHWVLEHAPAEQSLATSHGRMGGGS